MKKFPITIGWTIFVIIAAILFCLENEFKMFDMFINTMAIWLFGFILAFYLDLSFNS